MKNNTKKKAPEESIQEDVSSSSDDEVSTSSSSPSSQSSQISMESKTLYEKSQLIIIAGTYDGVLAGWESNSNSIKLRFALSSHDSSIRSLSISYNNNKPHTLLSCGYDDTMHLYNLQAYKELGELKVNDDVSSTPYCSDIFQNKNALIGFSSGKLYLYEIKKSDWNVVHILSGHVDHGVSCLAIHPTGTMALSGGIRDSKVILWDLTKGKRAFTYKINEKDATVEKIRWSNDGDAFGYCFGRRIVIKSVQEGTILLETDLSSIVNSFCFLQDDASYIVCACNDGSLSVLSTTLVQEEVRGLMAVEPVEDPTNVGEDRIKCVEYLQDEVVVTANSGGVVSIMDLSGALKMMFLEEDESCEEDLEAVDILESVMIGSTGARITSLAVAVSPIDEKQTLKEKQCIPVVEQQEVQETTKIYQGKRKVLELSRDQVDSARELVANAKKKQKENKRK